MSTVEQVHQRMFDDTGFANDSTFALNLAGKHWKSSPELFQLTKLCISLIMCKIWWLPHHFPTCRVLYLKLAHGHTLLLTRLKMPSSTVRKCTLLVEARVKPPAAQLLQGKVMVAWQKKKKCEEQFAVHHDEPQSIRRVHFKAFIVSLVLLNGQKEIVFSHPEQTALYSINETGDRIDFSDLSGQTVLYCLQNHSQFFTFYCKLNNWKCLYALNLLTPAI